MQGADVSSLPPFARVIKEQRERRGMSRSQLAESSGLSYPYISQLETGLRKPSRSAANLIARALDLELDDLERTIPGDPSDQQQVLKAERFSEQLLSSGHPSESRLALDDAGPPGAGPGASDDLIGDMIDLLEEFEPERRLDVLAEVQKRAMQRMLDERTRSDP